MDYLLAMWAEILGLGLILGLVAFVAWALFTWKDRDK